jgi:MFS family permease
MMNRFGQTQELRRSLRLVTLSGCLFIVFSAGTGCPLVTQYFIQLGATARHFGLLAGIPLTLILLQFVGALLVNRVRSRKGAFVVLATVSRLLYLPIAALPLFFPREGSPGAIVLVIWWLSLSAGLANLSSPFWSSWMADLVPRDVLNRYWGARQLWMNVTWTVGYLALALFAYLYKGPVEWAIPPLVGLAVVAGTVDILLFLRVREPEHEPSHAAPLTELLLAPLRHPEYRTFVMFQSAWSASTMMAAAFMMPYAIQQMRMPGWQATVAWCMLAVGGVLTSRRWGQLADRHGQKVVILSNLVFKPLIVIIYMLITPETAFLLLTLAYLIDGTFNSALAVATNGLMVKLAPRQNRSMFIAYITGLSGVCGGLAAMLSGQCLHWMEGFAWSFAGRTWTNYHVMFAGSLVLRVACIVYAFRLVEPDRPGAISGAALSDIMGRWPRRVLRAPLDLYRGMMGQ